VLADAPRQIERRVQELIDWLVSSELRQWQAIHEHLARRRHEHADRIVGQAGGSFDFDRIRLLERVGGVARQRSRSSTATGRRRGSPSRCSPRWPARRCSRSAASASAPPSPRWPPRRWSTSPASSPPTTLVVLGLAVIPNRRRRAKIDLTRRSAACAAT
jgi:hypothetical protein